MNPFELQPSLIMMHHASLLWIPMIGATMLRLVAASLRPLNSGRILATCLRPANTFTPPTGKQLSILHHQLEASSVE